LAHTAAESLICIDNALKMGFDDLTVDLIYGAPTTSDKQWEENMYPKSVRVESYRINMYGLNGHFKSHKDTPAKGLVGTGLLAMSDDFRKHLEIQSSLYVYLSSIISGTYH